MDEIAIAEYAILLDEARANGARIVGFMPPHYAGVSNTPDYAAFIRGCLSAKPDNRSFKADVVMSDMRTQMPTCSGGKS